MTYSVRLLPEAYQDLQNLYHFYEVQTEGLGQYCVDSVFVELDRLAFFAGIHLKALGYHRALTKRFPLSIYYTFNTEEVVVVAILDNRAHPQKRISRLAKN
jgi:plasmid stabilization system protein ParE